MDDAMERFEAVVVGGGAAGLSAASTLARARRSVLVVDAGRPRNAPAEGVHGFLTRDGMAPLELVEAGRAEVAAYGGRIRTDTVTHLRRTESGFELGLGGGAAVAASRLLVATGLRDTLPAVPGLGERFGRDVLHCPYCHGWEVRDAPIAVLASGPMAIHQALLFRQWSSRVTLLRHTAPPPSPADAERLDARGIAVVDGEVAGLEVAQDRLVGVTFADGSSLACRALAVAPVFSAVTGLLEQLGAATTEMRREGHLIATHVEVDATGATSVPGVWAAGNVANPMAQVVAAAESGVRAGAAINADLVEADTAAAVAARRAALSH